MLMSELIWVTFSPAVKAAGCRQLPLLPAHQAYPKMAAGALTFPSTQKDKATETVPFHAQNSGISFP